MRLHLLFLLLLTSAVLPVRAQWIGGYVLDRDTEAAIPFADVYFEGTLTGSISDSAGYFRLPAAGRMSQPVTVSAIGYYSCTVVPEQGNTVMKIRLVPRYYQLPEVTFGTRSLERERASNMKLFRKEFFGTSSMARRCEILNEEDITFNYGSDRDTLIAVSREPIRILNNGLGYEITYYMDRFSFDRNSRTTSFFGSIFFRRDLSSGFDRRDFERNRRNAYRGSCLHFFRTVWNDELGQTPFRVFDTTGTELQIEAFTVMGEEGRKYLHHDGPLTLTYHTAWSRLSFQQDSVPFEQSGYHDPRAISWQGRMGIRRIGDWLPYDYDPE